MLKSTVNNTRIKCVDTLIKEEIICSQHWLVQFWARSYGPKQCISFKNGKW